MKKLNHKVSKNIIAKHNRLPILGHLRPIEGYIDFIANHYGCKIMTSDNDRFSFASKEDRHDFIEFCYSRGLQPAILGLSVNSKSKTAKVYLLSNLNSDSFSTDDMRYLAVSSVSVSTLEELNTPEPVAQKVAAPKPVHHFAYCRGKLVVASAHKNKNYSQLVQELFDKLGMSIEDDFEGDEVAVGDILSRGKEILHKQAVKSDIRSEADRAIQEHFTVKSVKETPDYQFVFYNGALKIVPNHHNNRPKRMFEDLLRENGYDRPITLQQDIDESHTAFGNIYDSTKKNHRIEHKHLTDAEIREEADEAINSWIDEHLQKEDDWQDWSLLNGELITPIWSDNPIYEG